MRSCFDCDRLVAAVDRRHRAIILVAVLLLLLSGLSLLRLRLDMDVLSQLPSRSQIFTDYREFLQTFGVFDSLVILVRGERERIVPFADALAKKLGTIPDVGSVRYRIDLEGVHRQFLEPFRYQLLPEDAFDELARRLEPEAIDARVRGLRRALAMPMSLGARRWIVEDPLGVEELVGRAIERRYADPLMRPSSEYFMAADGGALLIIVRPVRSAFDAIFAERLLEQVRRAERELLEGSFRGLTVGHTGSYVYAVADKRVIESDMRVYFLFAPLAVLAIFHLGVRTLRILPFVTFPLLVITAITFALSLLLFGSLNMISVAFAGVFYGLGIDSAIYFYGLLREKAAGRAPLDAAAVRTVVAETLREIGAANVVASVTTAVAFFVIGLSDFTGVSQLGIMTGLAMLLNVVATFVLLPAMVFAWGPRAIPPSRPSPFAQWWGRVAVRLALRRTSVLLTVMVLLGAAAAAIPRVRLDTDFTHLRPGGGEAERVERIIRDEFQRIDAQGMVLVHGRDVDECLRATERVAARLDRYRDEGLVRSVSTLTAFLPSSETAARRLARFQALPRARAAGELRRALADSGFELRPFSAFLDDLVRDERPHLGVEGQERGPLAGLLEQHLRRTPEGAIVTTYFVPAQAGSLAAVRARLRADLPDVALSVTGRALVEGEFARLLERELAWLVAAALVLNLAVVLAAERRILRALALLSPTLAALILYLGLIGALDLPIDPINLIVLPLLIGLGVDDTVYLVAHVRHGGGLEAGVRRGVMPLLLAVGTTVAGFGSLGLSRFPALSRLGCLAALGLSLCLTAALVLVPALLDVLGGRRPAGELPTREP
jgi:predicted RND superfamily exporter protein